jgi:hypothetical protein
MRKLTLSLDSPALYCPVHYPLEIHADRVSGHYAMNRKLREMVASKLILERLAVSDAYFPKGLITARLPLASALCCHAERLPDRHIVC